NNGAFVLSVSSTLGVDEIDLSNLKIYPNPTDGLIIFNNNPEPLDLIIYDINGRIVIERKNYFLQELNISELNAGIYFMQINNSYTQKIIKK
ncbi:MAG: T9SS type A sorting domain-containing protein, partial [Flavobacteriaceae bacterium]|nr:T9SS type A sorting domain-containing protein [Flavobacteriaceae bacterium]